MLDQINTDIQKIVAQPVISFQTQAWLLPNDDKLILRKTSRSSLILQIWQKDGLGYMPSLNTLCLAKTFNNLDWSVTPAFAQLDDWLRQQVIEPAEMI